MDKKGMLFFKASSLVSTMRVGSGGGGTGCFLPSPPQASRSPSCWLGRIANLYHSRGSLGAPSSNYVRPRLLGASALAPSTYPVGYAPAITAQFFKGLDKISSIKLIKTRRFGQFFWVCALPLPTIATLSSARLSLPIHTDGFGVK